MNMNEHTDFAAEYRGMTDEQLLEIAGEGELVDEALQALRIEMQNRKLTPEMVQSYHSEMQRYQAAQKARTQEALTTGFFRKFGRAYLSEEDKQRSIQVRTEWFALRGLPIIPIASYRCSSQKVTTGFIQWKEDKVIDRVPLNWNQVIGTWVKSTGLFVLVISLAIIYLAWNVRSHR
jgi:hypothetical protein